MIKKSLLQFSYFLLQMFLNHSFWTDDGCKMVSVEDSNVTCECEHLTSFAVIMQIVPVWKQSIALYPVSFIGVLDLSIEYNIYVLFIS